MRKKPTTKKDIPPIIVSSTPWRLVKATPLKNYQLEVEFVDGTHGIVEMEALIMRDDAGVFAALKAPKIFNQVSLELGVATWPGEIDLAPDAMYDNIKKNGKWQLK